MLASWTLSGAGTIVKEPSARKTKNGEFYAFSIRRSRSVGGGNFETDFMDCEIFVQDGSEWMVSAKDKIVPELKKGADVFFTKGELIINKWEQDGQKRSAPRLRFDNFYALMLMKKSAPAEAESASEVDEETVPF